MPLDRLEAVVSCDVTPDGRYVADGDGPQEVNGFFEVRTSTGDAPNPLWQFDASVNLLTPTDANQVADAAKQRPSSPARAPAWLAHHACSLIRGGFLCVRGGE